MSYRPLVHEQVTGSMIGAFFEVAGLMPFGYLESLYSRALELELMERGHQVGRGVWVPVRYKHWELGRQRLDMVVDERVVIEVKSSATLHESAERQLFNYLRCTNLEVGLLLHFGSRKAEFRRVVCQNPDERHPQNPRDPGNPR